MEDLACDHQPASLLFPGVAFYAAQWQRRWCTSVHNLWCFLQALHQIAASPARATLEWHLEQHDSSFVSALSLDHIALAPLPGHHAFGAAMNALDFQDETSTDEDLEVSADLANGSCSAQTFHCT